MGCVRKREANGIVLYILKKVEIPYRCQSKLIWKPKNEKDGVCCGVCVSFRSSQVRRAERRDITFRHRNDPTAEKKTVPKND